MITKSKQTSQFQGVSWNKQQEKWNAYLRIDNKKVHLASFENEKDAAECHDMAKIERRLFKGLNFHHYKELQEDTSMAAIAAIAAAGVVAGAGAAATLSSDVGSTSSYFSKFVCVTYFPKRNKYSAKMYGLAKRSLTKIPEHSDPTDLFSYLTNENEFDNLLTVRSCYTSDVLVWTNIPFYEYYYDHHHYYDILLYCCAYIILSAAHCSNLLK
jgi:hypothetical protein